VAVGPFVVQNTNQLVTLSRLRFGTLRGHWLNNEMLPGTKS
jgi:hypothetical protein